MRTFILSLLVMLAAFFSCGTAKKSVQSSDEQGADSVLVAIDRGACFGRCPEYYACVSKSRIAWYKGRRNVKKTGVWKAQLSEEQYKEVLAFVRSYKVEQMDTVYINKYLADFPAYELWVSDHKPLKHILVNHEAPPEEITGFTKRFEEFLERTRWEQVSAGDQTQE